MRRGAAIACFFFLILIVVLSLIPGRQLPNLTAAQMSAGHAGLYLVQALLTILAFQRKIYAVVFCFVLGFTLEILQELVDGRGFEMRDIYANTAGLVFGIFLAVLLRLTTWHPAPAE